MPYIPSKKTDRKSNDREILDSAVEDLANEVALKITHNLSLVAKYTEVFLKVSQQLYLIKDGKKVGSGVEATLAKVIYKVGAKYNYEGAYLGGFNYAFTRFIQRVPQIKVQNGAWEQELRYWVYATTIEALALATHKTRILGIGIGGVFEDIKDEYKRRVNTAYEAEQILKSGDCYDTPYYTRLVEVVNETGTHIGYQEIMLKRSDNTLELDILSGKIVLRKK